MSLSGFACALRRQWPLLLLAAGGLLAGLLLWQFWPQILLQSIQGQRSLNQAMAGLLQHVAQQPQQAGLTLLGFSLLYGILHALGPGHGKVVIATFLATHPAKLKTSIRLTLLAALLQGSVAIGLVTLMLVVLQTSSRQLHLSSAWLEKGSYLLVMVLGGWIGWRALRALRVALQPAGKMRMRVLHQSHAHPAHCGCGHAHLPDAQQLAQAVSVKTQALVVLSMGLRPCSGAIMMLLFAKVINVYAWGVASALAMAAGTACTVSLLGVVVQRSRRLGERLAHAVGMKTQLAWLMPCLALLGAGVLIIAGGLLWQGAAAAGSGIRPF